MASKLLVLSASWSLIALPCPAQDEPPSQPAPSATTELNYSPRENQNFAFLASSQMNGELRIRIGQSNEAHTIALNLSVKLQMDLKYLSKVARGFRFEQKIAWIELAGKIAGQEFRFDSRKPTEARNKTFAPLFDLLRAAVEKPLQFEVGLRGGASYTQKSREDLASLGGLVNPDDLERILDETFPPLPEPAGQAVGASWEKSQKIPLPSVGDIEIETVRKLAEVADGKARVDLEITPMVTNAGDDEKPSSSFKTKSSTGSERYNLEDGLLEQKSSKLELGVNIVEKELVIEGTVHLGTEISRQ